MRGRFFSVASTSGKPSQAASILRSASTDGAGIPQSVLVTGANVHDKWLVPDVLDAVALRTSRGPRRPKHLCLDKGYDYADVEAAVPGPPHRSPHRSSRRAAHARLRTREAPTMSRRTHEQLAQSRPWTARALGAHRGKLQTTNYLAMLQLASGIVAFQAARLQDVLLSALPALSRQIPTDTGP